MCNPCKPLLKTGPSVFLHARVHVIRKKTCKQWWFPSPMCSLNVTVTAVCEGGEKKRKKVICYNRQALLLLACCGLTGFRNFLWQIWSPVRISTALLDTRTRTGMESLESVKFTGSSQREKKEKDLFFLRCQVKLWATFSPQRLYWRNEQQNWSSLLAWLLLTTGEQLWNLKNETDLTSW